MASTSIELNEEQIDTLVLYSTWKIHLIDHTQHLPSHVYSSFQNSSFRRNGKSIICPQTYTDIYNKAKSSRESYVRHQVLSFAFIGLVLGILGYPDWPFLLKCTIFLFCVLLLDRLVTKKILFGLLQKKVSKMIESYQVEFDERFGINLGVSWEQPRFTCFSWKNKSHIWMRRPVIDTSSSNALIDDEMRAHQNSGQMDGTLPTIFIHMFVPGDNYILEVDHDWSMNIDPQHWHLIQDTHKRMTMNPAILCCLLVIPWIVVILLGPFMLVPFFESHGYDNLTEFSSTWGTILCLCAILAGETKYMDYRAHQNYREVASSVSSSLRCENLRLEFLNDELLGRSKNMSRRYQLVELPTRNANC